MANSSNDLSILDILDRKIVPWIQEQGVHRLVVANEQLDKQTLPEGMQISRIKLRGKRVAVRGPRDYGNHANRIAYWPDDDLREFMQPVILCIVSGQATVQVRDRLLNCEEGHFLLIPPRTPFSTGDLEAALRTGNAPDVMAFLNWDDHLQCRLAYSVSTTLYTPNAALIQLLELVLEEALSPRQSDTIVAGLFSVFLAMLRRDLVEGRCFGQSPMRLSEPHQSGGKDPIQRVCRHVKSNLGQHFSTDDAATMALMSRAHFTRHFRQETGISFNEYVTQCRVEEAKMLLRETDWTISAIYKFVGFKDSSRLRRLFSERVGMSLIDYRRRSRDEEIEDADK